MAMFCMFLLLMSYPSLTIQGEIRIVRETIHPDDDILLKKDTDECPKVGSAYNPNCRRFNAAVLGGCWCQCGSPNQKNTFFELNNTCVKVSEARQQSGCDLLFTEETYDGPLTFFPIPGIAQKTVNVPANKTCSVYFGDKLYIQYLNCDGSWQQIPTQHALDNFEVTPGWSESRLHIRSKAGATVLTNNTARIFRVAVQCHSQHEANVPSNSSTCVMFKVQGETICAFPRPTPQTGAPSATLPPPITGTIIPMTGTLPPLPTVMEKTTTGTTSQATEQAITTQNTEAPETTQRSTEPSENPGVLGDTGARGTSKKNTFIIAGAVAGGILLIALILLILWRCNNPKRKRDHLHRRLEGSISSPISQMSRHSIPVYTDAAQFSHMGAMGSYGMRTSSMDNPTYRRGVDGIILGPDFKRGSLYPNIYPTSAPPRPPNGKRSSINGHVNPGLTLREEIVTMNPLFEGQVIEHKDLDALNCSDFGLHPDQIVLDERKNPEAFNEVTYDCPEEILKGKPMTSTPVPVYYVVDDPYPDSISNTFGGDMHRGRPDGHVYDEPEGDLARQPYVVMDNPSGVAYAHEYDDPRRHEGLMSTRRQGSPNHGILKVGSTSPRNQRYPSQSDYDDGHMQVI